MTKEEHDEISQMLFQNYLGCAKNYIPQLSADDADLKYLKAVIKHDIDLVYVAELAKQLSQNSSLIATPDTP